MKTIDYVIVLAILIILLLCCVISGMLPLVLNDINLNPGNNSSLSNGTPVCCPAFPRGTAQQDYRIIQFRSDLTVASTNPKNLTHFYSIIYLDLVHKNYVHFLYNDSQLVDTAVYVNGTYYKSAVVNFNCTAGAARTDFYTPLSQDQDVGDLGMFLTIEALGNRSGGYIPTEYQQQMKQTGPNTYAIVLGPHSPENFVFKRYGDLYLADNLTIYTANGVLNYAYSDVTPISEADFKAMLDNEASKLKKCTFTY
jgi:hypothetical protein